jgi:hypothetical protein
VPRTAGLARWWLPQFVVPNAAQLAAENPFDVTHEPPLKPAGLEIYRKFVKDFLSGQDTNAAYKVGQEVYCRPFRFNGVGLLGLEVEAAVEFLFTPGRVTLTDELGHLRRVFTDGREPFSGFGETNSGVSTGRWEGQTLVVETTRLSPHARFSLLNVSYGGVELGKGALVTERIFLKRKDVLQVDSVVIAPEVLTGPYKRTVLYQRDPGHQFNEFSYCNEYDRSIDPTTGHQRLDVTPPADLPPPPAG